MSIYNPKVQKMMTASMTFTNYAAKVAVVQAKLAEAARELAELHELFWRGAVSWTDQPSQEPDTTSTQEAIRRSLDDRQKWEAYQESVRGFPGTPAGDGTPPLSQTPPVPGDIPTAAAPPAGREKVEEVMRANDIPYRRLGEADYVLTDHVVTPDLTELFYAALGDKGWTVSGQVAGPPADLRRRPDLFKPKGTGPAPAPAEPSVHMMGNSAIVVPGPVPPGYGIGNTLGAGKSWLTEQPGVESAGRSPAFDGSTGTQNPVARTSIENVPNSGDK